MRSLNLAFRGATRFFQLFLLCLMLPDAAFSQGWYELGIGANALPCGNTGNYTLGFFGNIVLTNGTDAYTGETAIYRLNYYNSSWSELGSNTMALNANSFMISSIAGDSEFIYAAGNITDSMPWPHGNYYVAKWNDTNWTEAGSGNNSLKANGTINALAGEWNFGHSHIIYAAGFFTDSNHYSYVARWNDTTWAELGTGVNALNANSGIECLATDSSNNIYAAGDFTNTNGNYYVAKWNGSSWSELGGANSLKANGPIHAILVGESGYIYVAGNFTNASGKYYVAKWNDTSWSELGGTNALGADSAIYALMFWGGSVYAGGAFTNANGKHYVAEWAGNNWFELGTGQYALNANGSIYALSWGGGGLSLPYIYATGKFTDANGMNYVAEYDPTLGVTNISNTTNNLKLYPNPASGMLTVSLQNNSGNTQVHITDLVGREIYSAVLNTNELSVNVSDWSNGMYFCTVCEGDVKSMVKFVVGALRIR